MRVIKGNLTLDVKADDRSNKIVQLSGLQPPKNFLKEKNQQKRPIAKKLIDVGGDKVVDIDDDTINHVRSKNVEPSPKMVEDDVEWEEARVSNISTFKKNENIKRAKHERNNKKPCVTTMQQGSQRETYESDTSDEIELPNEASELNQLHMNRDLKKKEERCLRIDNRTLKRVGDLDGGEKKTDCCDSIVNEIEIEEVQSAEDDGKDGGWKRRGNRTELQASARHILNYCDKIGKNLRHRLSAWGEHIIDEADGESNFCTDLLNIRNSEDDSELLNDKSFEKICPGLVLKGYQLVGVNWLKLLHKNAINGVLADDMGLGKTVQSIAFLGWLRVQSSGKNKAHLIVVPASTLTNWTNELQRFCPSLKVVTYHGTQDYRADLRYDLKKDLEAGKVDVMLSTFNIFERDSARDDRNFLYKMKFEYLIIDEAHILKVNTSARFINLNAVNANHRLLLSGTPVQNNLRELFSLMSFLMPRVFAKIDIDELLEGFGWGKNNEMPSVSSSAISITGLRAMLAPFILRRVKTDVLDQLVDKVSFLEMVQMTSFQRTVYDNILTSHARKKENIKLHDSCKVVEDSLLTGKYEMVQQGEKNIVSSICPSEAAHLFTALRKAANHPLLLRVRYNEEEVMAKIAEVAFAKGKFGHQCNYQRVRDEIDTFSDFSLHQLCLEYPDSLGHLQLAADTLYTSQKMQKLKEMLPRLAAEGRRMLLFSQWTRLLDLLEVLLHDIGMTFLRLDGSTAVKDRQELIDEFSALGCTIPVFLLSTKAGGLGINLVAADTVIMHDLDFNPENDRQAEDRCHRIGQTKAVRVYRLVTNDTVDEDIFEIGERKRKLTTAVLSDHHSHNSEVKKSRGRQTKGTQQGNVEGEDADIGAIGRILQRALQKRGENKEKTVSSSNSGGDIAIADLTHIKADSDVVTVTK